MAPTFKKLIAIFGLTFSVASNSTTIMVPKYFVQLSERTDVPADILYALAVKETNTRMSNKTVAPWPFTLNVNGRGYRYRSYEEMIGAAEFFIVEETKSVDIGLFQVNWKWNGHRALSIHDLGLPTRNGEIAAEILKEHYSRVRDWSEAAGRFHNPANRNGLADRYASQFRDILEQIQSGQYQKNLNSAHTMSLDITKN